MSHQHFKNDILSMIIAGFICLGIIGLMLILLLIFLLEIASSSKIIGEVTSPDKSLKVQLVRKGDDDIYNEPLYNYLLIPIANPSNSKTIGICEVYAENGLTQHILVGWKDNRYVQIKFASMDLKQEKLVTVDVKASKVPCEQPSNDD